MEIGIEAIPFMTELNENLRVAHEQGYEERSRRQQLEYLKNKAATLGLQVVEAQPA